MSSDALYFKVATDSLSSTIFLPYATSSHGVKYLFLGTKNNSLFSKLIGENLFRKTPKEQEDIFLQFFFSDFQIQT